MVNKMDVFNRLKKVKKQMEKEQVDAFFVANEKNVRYLTNFTGDESTLLITKETSYFITDARFIEQAKTELPETIKIVLWKESMIKEIIKQLNDTTSQSFYFEDTTLNYQEGKELVQGTKAKAYPANGLIERLRVIKDEEEIKRIKKACEITDQVFDYILTFIKPGVTEKQIAAEMEYKMKQLGAQGTSFPTIVASGIRSSFPHGTATDKKIEKGDLITLDFGVSYHGYPSDMTRTIAVGQVDKKLESIYHEVLNALENGLEHITDGQTCGQLDAIVRESLKKANLNQYFTHGTGHSIGLDIHEQPIIRTNGKEELKENMIMTIEPGVYIAGLGGIRIEDDVLVTKGKGIVLNHSPKHFITIPVESTK